MKFISLQDKTVRADQKALAQEYSGGAEYTPARIGTEHFFFKSGLKVYYLPLAEITRCFRRVEFIDSRVGCCEMGMPMESMVICGPEETELAQIRMAGERMGKALADGCGKPHTEIPFIGDMGVCPVCHSNFISLIPGQGMKVECPICGIEGTLSIENGEIKVNYA